MSACQMIVFAKAPAAGFAKTRLIPALGAAGAARLAERLLDNTLAQALAAGVGPVELCCAPDAGHPAFRRHAAASGVRLALQGDGDLGERMLRSFERALREHDRALLIGTDVPGLDAAYLRDARDALREHDAVFGPAADGGYALVGLRRPIASLFDRMPWSTSEVMSITRERLHAARLRHVELPVLHDIDEPSDLTTTLEMLR